MSTAAASDDRITSPSYERSGSGVRSYEDAGSDVAQAVRVTAMIRSSSSRNIPWWVNGVETVYRDRKVTGQDILTGTRSPARIPGFQVEA